MFFSLVSSANATDMSFSSGPNTGNEIQKFIDTDKTSENVIVLNSGNYTSINNLNITRNVTIKGDGQVNIIGSGGTLFNIKVSNVKFVNLNISGYKTAITSNSGNLSVIGCNISTSDVSINLEGSKLTGILIENNTINSSISRTSWQMGGVIYVTANTNSNVSISLKNNIITGNGKSLSTGVYFNIQSSNNSLIFENNTIIGTGNGVLITASNSDNDINFTNNSITAVSGILLYISNSNNIISVTKNNLIGNEEDGIYISGADGKNNIYVVENNVTGYGAGMNIIASGGEFSGLSLFNNTFKSTSVGILLGQCSLWNNVTITGNNIFAKVGITHYYDSNINIVVNYNRIITTSYGLRFSGTVNGNSNFDYNWWGINDITNKIIGFSTNNHYILAFINFTDLSNIYLGDKLNFALLVLNTTLTNDGVENLHYFIIEGTFNGIDFSSSTDNLFMYQFTVSKEGLQFLNATLDEQYIELSFEAFKNEEETEVPDSNSTNPDNGLDSTNSDNGVDSTNSDNGLDSTNLDNRLDSTDSDNETDEDKSKKVNTEKTKDNQVDKISNVDNGDTVREIPANTLNANASTKPTGVPIAILLILAILGLVAYRKNY
jgi:hypothetical protein